MDNRIFDPTEHVKQKDVKMNGKVVSPNCGGGGIDELFVWYDSDGHYLSISDLSGLPTVEVSKRFYDVFVGEFGCR